MPAVPDLTGPFGALLLALAVLGVAGRALQLLWKAHREDDADDRAMRDRAMALAEAQVAATNAVADGQREIAQGQRELAAAFNEYIREQANRRRRDDR